MSTELSRDDCDRLGTVIISEMEASQNLKIAHKMIIINRISLNMK